MFTCRKKTGKQTTAYCLGDAHPVLDELLETGKLKRNADGTFAVLSQEAALAGSSGQIANSGDYIKLDSTGYPYPNQKEWFETHHRHIEGDVYEQIPEPLQAWTSVEPVCEEIQFLIDQKGLVINPADPQHYFTAPLWGTMESAASNAVIIFYSITRSDSGSIENIDFNFVERNEFERTYDLI